MQAEAQSKPFDATAHEETLKEAIHNAISKYQEFMGSNRNYVELLELAANLVGSYVTCEEMAVIHRMDDDERYSHIKPFIARGKCIERKLETLISKHPKKKERT